MAFSIFYGVIEGIDDPEKDGRYQVRIHNIHSPSVSIAPAKDLQWCRVAKSADQSASISGIGWSGTSLVKGSSVAGYFVDDNNKQDYLIVWSLSGKNKSHSGTGSQNVGFKDSDNVYPLSKDQPDIHPLAKGVKAGTRLETRDKNRQTGIGSASGISWEEPESKYASIYPNNKVYYTTSGHIIEYDDTPQNSRINIQHSSGSYLSFFHDGGVAIKDYGNRYDISKTRFVYSSDDYHNTVAKGWYVSANTVYINSNSDITLTAKGRIGLVSNVQITNRLDAKQGHFDYISAKKIDATVSFAICAGALCKGSGGSGASISVSTNTVLDTLTESYDLATTALEQSSKSVELDAKATFSERSPVTPTRNELWVNPTNGIVKKYSEVMNEWENVKMDYTFKLSNASKFMNRSVNLLIQSGLTPIIKAGTVWFNPIVNQIYEVKDNVWSIVNSAELQISKVVEEVRSIGGLTPEELLGKVTGLESFSAELASNSEIIKKIINNNISVFKDMPLNSITASVGDIMINTLNDVVSVKQYIDNSWHTLSNGLDIYNQYIINSTLERKSSTSFTLPTAPSDGDQYVTSDGIIKIYKSGQWINSKVDIGNIIGDTINKNVETGNIHITGDTNQIHINDIVIDGEKNSIALGNTSITQTKGVVTNNVSTDVFTLKYTFPLPTTSTIDSIFLTKNATNKICLMRYNGTTYEEL